jgi:hypothetical protein
MPPARPLKRRQPRLRLDRPRIATDMHPRGCQIHHACLEATNLPVLGRATQKDVEEPFASAGWTSAIPEYLLRLVLSAVLPAVHRVTEIVRLSFPTNVDRTNSSSGSFHWPNAKSTLGRRPWYRCLPASHVASITAKCSVSSGRVMSAPGLGRVKTR